MRHGLLIGSTCLLALLSTIGASLAYPLLPPLFSGAPPNELNSFLGLPAELLFGSALMANPLGMVLGSAVLGSLSDMFGRRRLLAFSTVGAAAGHLLTAYALLRQSFPLLLAARFFTGVLEGKGAILRAMLAERLDASLRRHALSWLNGSFNLGWLAGPLLSALTVGVSITLPFMVAACGLILGAIFAMLAFRDGSSDGGPVAVGGSWWALVRERHALTLLRHAPLRLLFTIHFAYSCAVAGLYQFFPLWLVETGGYDARGIALVNTVLCATMSFTALFAGRAHPAEARRRVSVHAAMVAVAILCVGAGNLHIGIAAIVLFGLPHAFYNATFQDWAVEGFSQHGAGAVMGLLSTTFCLARIAMALIGGLLAMLDTRLVLVVGGLLAGWAALSMRRWSHRAMSTHEEFA